jgi:hypothetical protein
MDDNPSKEVTSNAGKGTIYKILRAVFALLGISRK